VERCESLGQRLSQLMRERGLNYEALGRLLDMKPQTLNRYVLGQREPKAGVVMEMAARLGVDERWLQGYDVPQVRQAMPEECMIPVLGTIRAGTPEIAREDIEGWEPADVPAPQEYFYLRVQGDSMINAGIRTGDRVLIHRQSTAESGQIVACIVEEEAATLKRFRRQGAFVILQPENPAYEPRIVSQQEFQLGSAVILGVAVKLVRDLEL
jgi:repressor LexA